MINTYKMKLLDYFPEDSSTINALFLEHENSANINVVVYGSYNAGKSSLLNSIIGSTENEYFPTNDVPETRTNKLYAKNGINFIDTPGLDVNDADDESANGGVTKADIIIFVHKLSAGSIQQQDLDAFKRIFAMQANSKSVLFVLTAGEIASKNTSVIDEIHREIHNKLSHDVELFIVSNSVYKKGISESKPKLVEVSGMNILLNKLEALTETTLKNIENERSIQRKMRIEYLLKKIQLKQNDNNSELNRFAGSELKFKQDFVKSVYELRELVTNKIKEIKSI